MSRKIQIVISHTLIYLMMVSCYATNLKPIGETGKYFQPERDEQKLWGALAASEEKIIPKKMTYGDSNLQAYLEGIVRRVTPESYYAAGGRPINVKVRKDPRLNAAAMGHGLIVVFTGLLAAVENEDQLAGVIAHEVTHITHRHTIRQLRENQNKVMAMNVIAIAGTLALAVAAENQRRKGNYGTASAISGAGIPLSRLALKLTYLAMVNGYSRDLERESDQNAVKLLASAGYNPREYQKFMHKLGRGGSERGELETFFYGQHPKISERISDLDPLVSKYPNKEYSSQDRYQFVRKLYNVKVSNARYDVYVGRIGLAQSTLSNMFSQLPSEARFRDMKEVEEGYLYLIGSAYQLGKKNYSRSNQMYDIAVSRLKEVADADRGSKVKHMAYYYLGQSYYMFRNRKNTHCEAIEAYRVYLLLKPNAENARQVRNRMNSLNCYR